MPIALVHGVPDTTDLWDPFVAALAKRGIDTSDVTIVTLPGFDTPVPESFGATMDEYADVVALSEVRVLIPRHVGVIVHRCNERFTFVLRQRSAGYHKDRPGAFVEDRTDV